jgi:hypothetical protein
MPLHAARSRDASPELSSTLISVTLPSLRMWKVTETTPRFGVGKRADSGTESYQLGLMRFSAACRYAVKSAPVVLLSTSIGPVSLSEFDPVGSGFCSVDEDLFCENRNAPQISQITIPKSKRYFIGNYLEGVLITQHSTPIWAMHVMVIDAKSLSRSLTGQLFGTQSRSAKARGSWSVWRREVASRRAGPRSPLASNYSMLAPSGWYLYFRPSQKVTEVA